jgi:tRNA threonylcarbamoyladenosine biosynthesis protein TsaE
MTTRANSFSDSESTLTFDATSEEDTARLGRALARSLSDGMTVALQGTLGAGKTRLVQAIAGGCGIAAQDVTSPTFVLCQHYAGARQLHHFDAYRLADLDEFFELGPEEYFESFGITLIEWAERVEAGLPPDRMIVQIEVTGTNSRRFVLQATGPLSIESMRRLREEL